MTKKRNRKKKIIKEIDHIYDMYDLYSVLYSRSPMYKLGESICFSYILDDYLATHPKGKKIKSPRIIELCSGSSHHKRGFLENLSVGVDYYHCMDFYPSTNPEVIVGNLRDEIPPDYNVMLGYFFFCGSVLDDDMVPTTNALKETFTSIYNSLKRAGGGIAILDLPNNPYSCQLLTGCPSFYSSDGECESSRVPFNHPLRKTLGIPKYGSLVIESNTKNYYDRLTNIGVDDYTGCPVRIVYEDKEVGLIKVKKPFMINYLSEIEAVRLAVDAGFKVDNMALWHCDYAHIYPSADMAIKLEREMWHDGSIDLSEEEVEALQATTLVLTV